MTTPLVIDLTAPVRPPRRARRAAVAFALAAASFATALNVARAGDTAGCGCTPDPAVVVATR